MARVVCIDSTIFIWGIKRDASEVQKHKIPQAVRFIEWLDEEATKILLPTPVITELLSHVNNQSEKDSVLKLMTTSNVLVKPFDIACSLKCSELLYKTFNDLELKEYTKEHKIPKAKIKYDSMIASTAIVNKCDCIYTEDGDIVRYSHGQIDVFPMPSISVQTKLFDKDSQIDDLPF